MSRSILAGVAVAAAVAVLSGTGCQSTGVGDPCTPEQEYSQAFLGFNEQEVSVEGKSFQCQTRLCLVNHFRGRVSCPYGQNATGQPKAPATQGCITPGIGQAVDGTQGGVVLDPMKKATVAAQCTNRTADKAVYCSCHCQNVDGQTNDGQNYCTCPDGFSCTQLVSAIGSSDIGLTGGYCIKNGTQFDPNNPCASSCDPAIGNCGPVH
jgi:hypothetical protein